jgi:CheY-like chemotaxis protein
MKASHISPILLSVGFVACAHSPQPYSFAANDSGNVDLVVRTLQSNGLKTAEIDRKQGTVTTYWFDTGYRFRETDILNPIQYPTNIFLRYRVSLKHEHGKSLRLMQSTLPSNITCKFDGREQACTVEAHPAQLHQIVMNLCTNAVHAMRPTGGTLTVNVSRRAIASDAELNPGDYVVLSVADTGVGMDAGTLGRVFEPYFTTKPNGQGTGLGLSVAHGIVKSLGGRIRVRSLPGQGTTFELQLPAASEQVSPQTADAGTGPRGTARILLVDDDPNITRLAERMLAPLGYQVTSVNDSRAALDLWSRSPESYDLLISDQVMPELSGAEMVKQVLAVRPNLPVIVWSGCSENLDPSLAQYVSPCPYGYSGS